MVTMLGGALLCSYNVVERNLWQGYREDTCTFCRYGLLRKKKKKKNCMFYQLLRVQHSCSSTQSWGSVLPSIVEMRDQNSRGCPLLFSNRNLGSFCA